MKDKEKQICKYCGKPIKSSETKTIKERIADYDGNYFCSCDKEKQIEEMFNYLRECSNNAWAKGFDYAEIDNEKLRAFLDLFLKDSVVLSREEYEALKKQIEYWEHETKVARQDLFEESKETAEKFVNLPKSKILTVIHDYEEIKVVELKELQELAKQFGVEIKE